MKINRHQFVLKYFVLMIIGLFLTSCVPREKIVYFQGDLESIDQLAEQYSATIQPDDLLSITVFGRNEEATRIFNQESNVGMGGMGNQKTYLVDEEGNIEFPVLGKIKLAGLTRNEAIQYMKGMLSNEIIDPGVSIAITNYRITVLGEVGSPGTYPLENEKVTILEALGMAGDLTINGLRDNVLVVREENGKRNFYRVNLLTEEVFNSPVYYLAQNDVVYVEPNQNKINSSRNATIFRDISFAMSISSFLLTIILLITK
ncbi:polysaccharide biosynthesis/export family protein [Moheibacter lacus]|uniref:Polysaccharide export protein n=1 Tax=Moheibacter lacus TaxID=2745851 RepID=A0A838ZI37_9FLAO|nr:polysaccharide biosynthesis/export family protein [Moheibacter lacus]MBA5628908.1 polysaccharide export protein [Moheibacter lacus]